MGFLDLSGLALAALLSENFILVSCMGIGTRTQSFQSPADALRTGGCLTMVMVLCGCFTCLAEFLLVTRFGLQHFRLLLLALLVPALVAGLRRFFSACLPELSRRVDENLASISTNAAALGVALLVGLRSYSLGETLIFSFFGGVGATMAMASFASLRNEVSFDALPGVNVGGSVVSLTSVAGRRGFATDKKMF